jgi:hypothetical protein
MTLINFIEGHTNVSLSPWPTDSFPQQILTRAWDWCVVGCNCIVFAIFTYSVTLLVSVLTENLRRGRSFYFLLLGPTNIFITNRYCIFKTKEYLIKLLTWVFVIISSILFPRPIVHEIQSVTKRLLPNVCVCVYVKHMSVTWCYPYRGLYLRNIIKTDITINVLIFHSTNSHAKW